MAATQWSQYGEAAMKRARTAVARRKADKVSGKTLEGFGVMRLLEYFNDRVVTELRIVEVAAGSFRIEVLLTWKSAVSVLITARGGERRFRSVDTVVRFLRSIGVGPTVIRLVLGKGGR
jgi:hypothetical protein